MARQQTKTIAEFQRRLAYASRVYALVAPLSIFVVCGIIEFLFTKDFSVNQRVAIPGLIGSAALLVIGRLVLKSFSRFRLAIEYIIMTILAMLLYRYLVIFPSPYAIITIISAVLIYFDFGATWACLSLAAQYIVIGLTVYSQHTTLSGILDVIAYCLVSLSLGILIIRLQALARQEVAGIEKNLAQAKASDQQVQSLINNISDGVIAVDEQLRVVIYNAAALDVLDVNTNIGGKSISRFLQTIDKDNQPVDTKELLANTTTSTINRDLRITYKDGSIANLFMGIAPIYLGYGNARHNGYTIILRDITREKSLEDERNEFISVVSHELRTPIAISEGNISNAQFIVDKTGDLSVVKKALSEAHNQVLFLADMINDLSTLSRAERGTLEFNAEPIAVDALVAELVNNYTPQAEAKKLKLISIAKTGLPDLQSSKLYVREILQNFITNAIKYTETGSVTIDAVSNNKGITFSVTDTGIGISKADQEKVYDKFFRSEDFRTRQNGGTGLGLYVTMKLVRLIHAEISLTSELNKGSTFSISIPNMASLPKS